MKRFAMLGVAGFVAPRHLDAIAHVGGTLVAACDPSDSVGVIDRHFPDAAFFTVYERFDRHLEKLRQSREQIDYVSVCSPNYLHDAHCRLGLRLGADVICEKPVVLNPWNVDQLMRLEEEAGGKLNTVLQLRYLPSLIAKKEELAKRSTRAKVKLRYVTRRGLWYRYSWKGDQEKSGGLSTNIGVHLFDLLGWFFGKADEVVVLERSLTRESGRIVFEGADVEWSLSTRAEDLPDPGAGHAYRCIEIDGEELEFSTGFQDLHRKVYEEVLAGRGMRLSDARPAIELVHRIRNAKLTA